MVRVGSGKIKFRWIFLEGGKKKTISTALRIQREQIGLKVANVSPGATWQLGLFVRQITTKESVKNLPHNQNAADSFSNSDRLY